MPPKKKAAATSRMTLVEVTNNINSLYGPGAIMLGSDAELEVHRWPTGVPPLDFAVDGGLPRGRFIEVYGPYSVLKSWWAYKSLAAVQAAGGRVALIDTEHSWDPEWGASLGVDTKELALSRPKTAEEAIGIIQALIAQRYDLFVFDSIAAAIPSQHAEVMAGEDTQPGALARVMSKGLARLTATNKHTTGYFINQTRSKIGQTFGSPVTTSGGAAMGFYASYRLSFVRTGKISHTEKRWDGEKMSDTKIVTGHKIKATLEKSKLSTPHSDVQFVYDLTTGDVDTVGWLIGQGLERGDITMGGGGYYDMPGVLDKKIQGFDAFRTWVEDNEAVIEWLTEQAIPQSVLARPSS